MPAQGPATTESLRARHDAIVTLFNEHAQTTVASVQQQALDELLPSLQEELDLDEEGMAKAQAFLEEKTTVFRFCRRARFSPSTALTLLHSTLSYRFSPASPLAAPPSSPYFSSPLFFFHPSLRDKFGRPCAVLNLREVHRTEDGSLDELKQFIRVGWEVGRRWLTELSEQEKEKEVQLQMVVIVDLEGAGMSNLEVELLPFFMDLLKNHFPGMVGAIFVLNYGWMYAGMWQVAKRVLPNTALERILFPSKAELLQFFDEHHLLVEHGGTLSYTYSPSNPILARFIPTPSTPSTSPASRTISLPSPAPSSTSLHTEVFHSAPSTRPPTPSMPSHPLPSLSRRTSGLSMTPSSAGPTSGGLGFAFWNRRAKAEETAASEGGSTGLRRVTSFAELQERLAETQAMIESDDSASETDEQLAPFHPPPASASSTVDEPESYDVEEDEEKPDEEGDDSQEPTTAEPTDSNVTSARSSRFSSRNVSRTTSREGSPRRRAANGEAAEAFSNRAVRFSGRHHLSPYNHSNPFYGYPAFVPSPSSSTSPGSIPQPHYHRRRKRDLVRTLTYLAVLRFLALHRAIARKLVALLDILLLRRRVGSSNGATPSGGLNGAASNSSGGINGAGGGSGKGHHVHWADPAPSAVSQTSSTSSSFLDQVIHHPVFALLVFLLVLRTPEPFTKLRRVLVEYPGRMMLGLLARGRGGAGVGMGSGGRVGKREWVRKRVGEVGRKAVEWSERK